MRISLGGGGTDLPSYYKDHGGFLIAAAIKKYVYVSINRPFEPKIYLKYSSIENVSSVNDVKHPIIRESLKIMNLRSPQIEITTIADIPSGTGLGSSGSFTTALLLSLFTHYRKKLDVSELAALAAEIEIEKLAEPVGKQDQYISAYGGIRSFEFNPDGTVVTKTLSISTETMHDLEDNLLLFFTGISRSASSILLDQDKKSRANDKEMIKQLHFVKDLGLRSRDALLDGNTVLFGELMGEHWQQKQSRSSGISNEFINRTYKLAMSNGACGGKLVGAGGGGFLMFYATDKEKLRKAMSEVGLEEVRFQFDFEGTKVILS